MSGRLRGVTSEYLVNCRYRPMKIKDGAGAAKPARAGEHPRSQRLYPWRSGFGKEVGGLAEDACTTTTRGVGLNLASQAAPSYTRKSIYRCDGSRTSNAHPRS